MTTPCDSSRLPDPTVTLELLRTHLLRGGVNKDDYARLRFLVNEEHAGAKPVRCGPEAGLGVHILRPTLFEALVCGGNLAGRERFTSTGIHHDAHRSTTARSNDTRPLLRLRR